MRHKATIRALLEAAEDAAHEQLLCAARITLRKAWMKQRVADFFAAQKRVEEAWSRIFDALPDDLDEDELEAIPEPPEQADVALVRRAYERRREAAPSHRRSAAPSRTACAQPALDLIRGQDRCHEFSS